MVIASDNLTDLQVALQTERKAAATEKLGMQREIDSLRRQLATVIEALGLERLRAYGARSEKAPGQHDLFDEAENDEASAPSDGTSDGVADDMASPTPRQRPRARAPLPKDLPRKRIVHELSDAERQCPCGCTMREIGETTSEQLDIIPAQVQVIEHVRKTYSCSACDESIRTAPPAPSILPKSIVSANTAAYLVTAKYADGLPLYRMSTILKRYGITLPRQTLSEAVLRSATRVEPLIEILRERLRQCTLLHMDETRVQVLKEPGKSAQHQSYMWVQRGGPPGETVVRFTYAPTRAATVPERLISDYAGAVMTDGYEVYRRVAKDGAFVHLVCWAHARRKFVEARKAQPKGRSGKADAALSLIGKLYGIERTCARSDAATRQLARVERAAPVLAELEGWLERSAATVAPKGALGRAIGYAREYWTELGRYVENGAWPIDNNAVENAIRPFVKWRSLCTTSSSV